MFVKITSLLLIQSRLTAAIQEQTDGQEQDIMSKVKPLGEIFTLPRSFDSCPSLMDVSKDDCIAAGLSLGGRLQDGKLVEGSWTHVSFGCSIQLGGNIYYNSNVNAENDKDYQPVCKKESFTESFTLPRSSNFCPSFMKVNKEDCAVAGLSLGGRLRDGKLVEGSWHHISFGCSIQEGGDIHYNDNIYNKKNTDHQPVCKKGGFTILPARSFDSCPSFMDVSKEDCLAAGLSIGGRVRDGKLVELVEGSWPHVSFGCSIQGSGGDIHYNNNLNGKNTNNGGYLPVCKKESFTLPPWSFTSCPSFMDMTKEDCVAAGLSLGGRLRDCKLVEGSWTHVSFGCSIQPGGDIHYNNNVDAKNTHGYIPVCKKESLKLPRWFTSCRCFLEEEIR